jgi:hypothetical protein
MVSALELRDFHGAWEVRNWPLPFHISLQRCLEALQLSAAELGVEAGNLLAKGGLPRSCPLKDSARCLREQRRRAPHWSTQIFSCPGWGRSGMERTGSFFSPSHSSFFLCSQKSSRDSLWVQMLTKTFSGHFCLQLGKTQGITNPPPVLNELEREIVERIK